MKQLDPLYLVKAFDKVPPFAWRGLAIHGQRGRGTRRLFLRELISHSGIPKRTFIFAMYKTSAANMTLEQISRMSAACGVNLLSRNPYYWYRRHHPTGDDTYMDPRQRKKIKEVTTIWERQQQRLSK